MFLLSSYNLKIKITFSWDDWENSMTCMNQGSDHLTFSKFLLKDYPPPPLLFSFCNWVEGLMCLQCRKQNSDTGHLQQGKGLLQDTKQQSGRQVSGPLPLALWVACVKRNNEDTGVNHHHVTFMWHYLIVFPN